MDALSASFGSSMKKKGMMAGTAVSADQKEDHDGAPEIGRRYTIGRRVEVDDLFVDAFVESLPRILVGYRREFLVEFLADDRDRVVPGPRRAELVEDAPAASAARRARP